MVKRRGGTQSTTNEIINKEIYIYNIYNIHIISTYLVSHHFMLIDLNALNALDFACIVAQDAVDGYVGRFEDDSLTERTTTDEYYDVATDFYLYGWGHSFHFATRFAGESLEDSIVRQVGEDFTYQLLPFPALQGLSSDEP